MPSSTFLVLIVQSRSACCRAAVSCAPEDPVEFEPQTFTPDSPDEFEVNPELLDAAYDELFCIDASLDNLEGPKRQRFVGRSAEPIRSKAPASTVGPGQLFSFTPCRRPSDRLAETKKRRNVKNTDDGIIT